MSRKKMKRRKSGKANKRQRDQMGIYFLALQQGVAPRMIRKGGKIFAPQTSQLFFSIAMQHAAEVSFHSSVLFMTS